MAIISRQGIRGMVTRRHGKQLSKDVLEYLDEKVMRLVSDSAIVAGNDRRIKLRHVIAADNLNK